MILQSVKDLFRRDLEKVMKEVGLYKTEADLWLVNGEITNSGGNLCLHLIGNLKAFIGAGLANTDYKRDRVFEFNGKDVSKEELITGLKETIEVVDRGLGKLSEADLESNFPIVIWEKETSMIFTLLHLHSHLNYHLGQINYHRRLLTSVAV